MSTSAYWPAKGGLDIASGTTSRPSVFENEVERARRVYDAFDFEGRSRRTWAAFAPSEATHRCQQSLVMARLMREAGFGDLAGLKVLDVGCGRGRKLREFLDMGARPEDLDGVDIHEPSLARARLLAPHLRFQLYNGWDLPFPDAHFDLVTQFVVFSSIALSDLRRRLAAEALRVLRPGGHVFWWDFPYLTDGAGDAAGEPLDVGSLFEGLPRREVREHRELAFGGVPIHDRLPGIVRPVLDRVPVVNRPPAHVAALVGPAGPS